MELFGFDNEEFRDMVPNFVQSVKPKINFHQNESLDYCNNFNGEEKGNIARQLNKSERLTLYKHIGKALTTYSIGDIENGVMLYYLRYYGCTSKQYYTVNAVAVEAILSEFHLPNDLETAIELFESLLSSSNREENGIVFTPQYIAEYITDSTICNHRKSLENIHVIDPGCGCGIFLVSAAEYILNNTHKTIDEIILHNIFGIDIVEDNVRRCNLILKLLSAKYGGNFETITTNVICADSLRIGWSDIFNVNLFDCIIGNPPYVNPHDMNKDMALFLKNNYITTKNGVYNIFYAFIEKGMNELHSDGSLSYIVPNNFLTIKSAIDLREYLQSNRYISSILDFGDNMVFKPIRTYNCIIQLNRQMKETFDYFVLPKMENIKNDIFALDFCKMQLSSLDKKGWKLVDGRTQRNIHRIESQELSIKNIVHTGIATLRDNIYFVDKDEKGFYKIVDGEKFYIESELVKPIYKIPDLKKCLKIDDVRRYIIFPYAKLSDGYTLIDEDVLSKNFPNTYSYLVLQRKELDARDNGKGVFPKWYAYGRTQGLNRYGKKLLFPTFAGEPRFVYVEDEDALFCNGYAIFDNFFYGLDVLVRILNSRVMEYYIKNTSYSIEGGYYCYQKKYVERFSIPRLSKEQVSYISSVGKEELDKFLWELYKLE